MPRRSGLEDEFDYNDGLGDMLKETERHEFSWVKTAMVLLTMVVVVVVVFMVSFRMGTGLFKDSPTTSTEATQDIIQLQDGEEIIVDEIGEGFVGTEEEVEIIYYEDIKAVKSSASDAKPTFVQSKVSMEESLPFKVIAGSFSNANNASRYLNKLTSRGITGKVWTHQKGNTVLYRILAGAYQNRGAADQRIQELKYQGISAYILTI